MENQKFSLQASEMVKISVLLLVALVRQSVPDDLPGREVASFLKLPAKGAEQTALVQSALAVTFSCSTCRCGTTCAYNESCTAAQFDFENSLCTLLFCSELQAVDKPKSILLIKSILSVLDSEIREFLFLCG